jgi:hypothetical protein
MDRKTELKQNAILGLGIVGLGMLTYIGINSYTAKDEVHTPTTSAQSDTLRAITDGNGNHVDMGQNNQFHEDVEVNQLYLEEKTYLLDSDKLINYFEGKVDAEVTGMQDEAKGWFSHSIDSFFDGVKSLYCLDCDEKPAQPTRKPNATRTRTRVNPTIEQTVDSVYIPPVQPTLIEAKQRNYGLGDYTPNCN